MTLHVKVSDVCRPEKIYILSVVLDHFLGIDYELIFGDSDSYVIAGDNGREIIMPDIFFRKTGESWLDNMEHPSKPLVWLDVEGKIDSMALTSNRMPVIFGAHWRSPICFDFYEQSVFIPFDIFGSAFYMISGIEETGVKRRDAHERLSARDSLALMEGFLDRPIIDEYVEILWESIKRLWPGMVRKDREYKTTPTHDVDRPFEHKYRKSYTLAQNVLADLVLRNNSRLAKNRLSNWFSVKRGNLEKDPFNTFNSIMDMVEKYNCFSTFYFLAGASNKKYDGDYSLKDEAIIKLMHQINGRGHKLGLHGSYNSFIDFGILSQEKDVFLSACKDNKIKLDHVMTRQHVLRWHTPKTFQILDAAGVDVDSSVAFADYAGFRCGTCHEFPVYDIENRKALRVKESPLIAMECSVIDDRYMGLGATDKALEYILKLKERCKLVNGNFVFLWHNTRFVDPVEVRMVEEILKA